MKNIYRFQNFLIFILPIISLLFVFRNVIFTNSIAYNGDILFNFYPYFYYFSKNSPLIIQQIFSGFPGFVTVSGIWFYPLNRIVFLFSNPINYYKYLTIINILLTYFFMYLYTRKLNFSHLLAIFVSSIFLFSSQLMLWSDTLLLTSCYFTLPLSLYLLETATLKSWKVKIAIYFLSGVVLGLGWLSSQPQFVFYEHVFFIVYVLFREKKYWAPIVTLAASFLVGLPQILATLIFKAETFRSTGVPLNEYFMGSYFLQDFIHYILPFFSTSPKILTFGSPNLYIGILPVILLIFAFVIRKRITNILFQFYLAVFVFCILVSIKYSPVGFFVHYLPIFKNFREAPRVMFIGELASAMVVGFCLEYILLNAQETSLDLQKYIKKIVKLVMFVCIPVIMCVSFVKIFFFNTLLNFFNNIFLKKLYVHTSQFPVDYYYTVIKIQLNQLLSQLSIGNYSVLVAFVCIVLSIILLLFVTKISSKHFAILSIGLVLLDFSLVYAFYYKTVSIDGYLSEPATVRFIKNREKDNKEPFRIYSILPNDTVYKEQVRCAITDESQSLELQKEFIVPNLNILYNLDAIDGYDQFTPQTVSEVTATLGSERAPTGPTLASEKISIEEKVKKISSMKELLKIMNVKYVISHYKIEDKDFSKIYEAKIGTCETVVYIYELNNYLPRYYFTLEKKYISVPAVYNSTGMSFSINTPTDTDFIVGNTLLHGWKAYVDGTEVRISSANTIYMLVPITKGIHNVLFTYELPAYSKF